MATSIPIESFFSRFNICIVQGISGNLSPGAFDFLQSISLAIDSSGNVALLGQSFVGGITTNSSPSASIVAISTVAFIPDYTKLFDMGYNIGGSAFTPCYGLGGGADLTIYPSSQDNQRLFVGLTGSAGIGTPSIEGHIDWGNTTVIFSFNIFQLIRNSFSH